MTKIRAIAERLRSDNANERTVASRKIEALSGHKLADVIEAGAEALIPTSGRMDITLILRTKTNDDMIVSLTKEIIDQNASWADIIEAGSQAMDAIVLEAKSQHEDNLAITEKVRRAKEILLSKIYRETESHPPAKTDTVPEANTGIKYREFVRVWEKDLPTKASGVPYIVTIGNTKDKTSYAVVRFHRMMTEKDALIAPMCDFIGFGESWVKRLRKAEEFKDMVTVNFGNDRTPNKAVIIREAA